MWTHAKMHGRGQTWFQRWDIYIACQWPNTSLQAKPVFDQKSSWVGSCNCMSVSSWTIGVVHTTSQVFPHESVELRGAWIVVDVVQFPGHAPSTNNQNHIEVAKGHGYPVGSLFDGQAVVVAFLAKPQTVCIDVGIPTSTFVSDLLENGGLFVLIISCTFCDAPLLPRYNVPRSFPR